MEDRKPEAQTREQSEVRSLSQSSVLPIHLKRSTDKSFSHREQEKRTSWKAKLDHLTKFGVIGLAARPQQVWQKTGLPLPLTLR